MTTAIVKTTGGITEPKYQLFGRLRPEEYGVPGHKATLDCNRVRPGTRRGGEETYSRVRRQSGGRMMAAKASITKRRRRGLTRHRSRDIIQGRQ